jgi:long-chain acyl-CoA synthetase
MEADSQILSKQSPTGEEMNETFCERVAAAASARPSKAAMILLGPGGAESTTYSSMLAQIRSLAFRLKQERIGMGDRVALLGENHPNWAMAYLGILFRGAVVVPLDPAATIDALANFISDSEAKLAFVSPSSLDKFRAISDRLGKNIPIVLLQPSEEKNGFARYEDWAVTPTPHEFAGAGPPAKAEDTAVLMYTSGTTGTPKAVPLTHGNIYAECTGIEEAMKITDREIVLGLLPMFHSYSQTVNLWLATIIGATVVYINELSSAAVERGLKESRATALLGVPRLWYLFHKKIFDAVGNQPAWLRLLFAELLRINGWLRDRLNVNAGKLFFRRVHDSFGGNLRLAVSGGASFDAGVARDFHRLGFTILQGYGLTETAAAATVTRFEDNLIGSVGTPIKDVEVKIDAPDSGGIGEVLIRGPIVTPGYYRNPEANREAFTSTGWFRTGDLGRFDRQGHLFIVGRKKEVIKLPSGKNVFPEDVEAHYQRSPFASEVCVIGVRDESSRFALDEKLVAVVVPDFDYLKSRQIANATEWIRWELDNLGQELPEYQRVRDYIIRSEPLPRTTTRKVKRFELKQQIEFSGDLARGTRDLSRFAFTADDKASMDSPSGKLVAAAIRRQKPEVDSIHPRMNLELDLGLDSLGRAELAVGLETAIGVEIKPEEAATALTAGDLIMLVAAKYRSAEAAPAGRMTATNWSSILKGVPDDLPDIQPILERRPVFERFAWLLLRAILLFSKIFFRLEVEGLDVVRKLPRPFLVCPNHQSYVDPLLVCSIYPMELLRDIFHVGYAGYFDGRFTSRLAQRVHIIPVDADVNLLRAMRAGAAGLRAGKLLHLYPEGQRSIGGMLMEFRKGAAILAAELNLPIVPVAIDGMHRVWGRGSNPIRPAKVKISFGAPIYPREAAPEGDDRIYEALTDLLKRRIQQMLDEMRGRAA